MGTKRKTPAVLDAMLAHVRYEAVRAINFRRVGNGWCRELPAGLDLFAEQSVLEAGLIHFRCLIEFLGNSPESDKVTARDYLSGWSWTIRGSLVKVGELHGRLAHIGTIRESETVPVGQAVATHSSELRAFEWAPWLDEHGPIVLGAFRDFLRDRRCKSPSRFDLIDRGNLLEELDALVPKR